MAKWIATWNDHFEAVNAAIVEADGEEEAARIAIEILEEAERDQSSAEVCDGVFVAPWDERVAYRRRSAVERAELQCCGGEAPGFVSSSPHWATCPERPPGTGQPREGEEEEEDAAEPERQHAET